MAKNDATSLSKHLPKPELGVLASVREQASAARAIAAVAAHVPKDKLHAVADGDRELLQIARHYWADKAYDEAMPVTDLRDQIGSAIEKAQATAKALKGLSKATKVAFIRELRHQRAFEAAYIEKLVANLEKFSLVASPLIQAESGSRGQEALKNCCARLVKLREQMTKATFKATLTPELGKGEATEAFKRPDPQFVLEIAAAIDPAVKFPAVRSALVLLASERSRKKSA